MIAFGFYLGAALRLNAGQFEFLRQNLREFVHREIDFEDVTTGGISGLPGAVLIHIPGSERLARLAFSLPDTTGVATAEPEVRHFDLRDRNADKVLSLFADQLTLRNVFLQVLLD